MKGESDIGDARHGKVDVGLIGFKKSKAGHKIGEGRRLCALLG
jgi:hypothetical protein